MTVAGAIVVRGHPTAVRKGVGRHAFKAVVVAAGVGRLGRGTQESGIAGAASAASIAGVSNTVAISVCLVGVRYGDAVVIHVRNPVVVLIRKRESVRAEHIVPNVVSYIEVRLAGIGDMARVETTKPHFSPVVTRLESLASGRPGELKHRPSTHTPVDRRPGGKAALRSLKNSAVVTDNPVIQAMESDDRDWSHRSAVGSAGVKRR